MKGRNINKIGGGGISPLKGEIQDIYHEKN